MISNLVSDDFLVKVSRLFDLVGFETLDEMRGLVGQAADESTDGNLELSPCRGRPSSGGAARISWRRTIQHSLVLSFFSKR